jgi:hypothetical protein
VLARASRNLLGGTELQRGTFKFNMAHVQILYCRQFVVSILLLVMLEYLGLCEQIMLKRS